MNTHDYDAVLMNLVNGDVDPTPEMGLWRYSGEMHLWDMGEKAAATPWEAELDKLMESQMTTTDYATRKKLYDRVQEIVAQNLPLVFLLSPDILVGAQSPSAISARGFSILTRFGISTNNFFVSQEQPAANENDGIRTRT